jgi:Zn-dependent M28 family amino/carboxypeptidase
MNPKGNMTINRPNATSFFTITVSEKVGAALLGRTFVPTKKQFEEINIGNYFAETKLMIQKNTATLESSNVIGIVEGSDKKDEYIFITGHYDHLGKRGDVIYYGADDDGSGTTAVMQLAETFAKAKAKGDGPRRTMVFMAVSGEEKGLWGSKFYADNPTFPLAKTSVDLNIDMIGRIDPSYKGDSNNYVFAIGEDKLSTELQPITDSVNKWYVNMEVDRRYNDPKDPNRFYFRSDHYNFAAKGIPIIFYFNGVHKDYHKPTDTVDKINFNLMHKRSLLVYYTAWEMANKNEMLKRDLPLSAVPAR